MWLWSNTALQRSRGKVKCEAKKTQVLQNWLTGLSQEKQFLFVVRKKSCSEAGRRRLWRFVSADKFLSASRQVGRTWRGQLMTGIWRIFWLSKQTCLSFVSSATPALVSLWRHLILDPTLWNPIGQFWTWTMAHREILDLHSKKTALG